MEPIISTKSISISNFSCQENKDQIIDTQSQCHVQSKKIVSHWRYNTEQGYIKNESNNFQKEPDSISDSSESSEDSPVIPKT